MNKETKAGTEVDSTIKADTTSVRQPCTKPNVVGSLLSQQRPIIKLYKSYLEKALSAETKAEFREYACGCGAVYDSARLLGNRDDVRAIRQVMNSTDILFTEHGKPDEVFYLLRGAS